VKAASLLEVAKGRDAPRLVGQRGEGWGMAIAPPPPWRSMEYAWPAPTSLHC